MVEKPLNALIVQSQSDDIGLIGYSEATVNIKDLNFIEVNFLTFIPSLVTHSLLEYNVFFHLCNLLLSRDYNEECIFLVFSIVM